MLILDHWCAYNILLYLLEQDMDVLNDILKFTPNTKYILAKKQFDVNLYISENYISIFNGITSTFKIDTFRNVIIGVIEIIKNCKEKCITNISKRCWQDIFCNRPYCKETKLSYDVNYKINTETGEFSYEYLPSTQQQVPDKHEYKWTNKDYGYEIITKNNSTTKSIFYSYEYAIKQAYYNVCFEIIKNGEILYKYINNNELDSNIVNKLISQYINKIYYEYKYKINDSVIKK